MTVPRRVAVFPSLAAPVVLCLAVLFLQIGCTPRAALPPIAASDYAGPPMSLDASSESYVIVIHSPSPGWVPTLDRVADQYKYKAIFVTLRRPNPTFYYPQSQVEQQVGTSVLSTEAIKVYARVLAFDEPAGSEPYSITTQSSGSRGK